MCGPLAAIVLTLLLAGCGGSPDDGPTATVAAVVDGDTILIRGGDHIRLVQIDSPEPDEDECYGAEASRVLEELLPLGSEVELEADSNLDDVDRFGRMLRYVHVDGLNVNLELVRRGAATVWFFNGDRGRYADDLVAAGEDARLQRRGLWAACPGTPFEPLAPATTGGGS